MEEKTVGSGDLERLCQAVSPHDEPCDYPATVHCEKCGRWLRRIRNLALIGALIGGLGAMVPSAVVAQAPDNSKTNQQDRGAATAEQQAENQGDRDLARKIRKSIMEDKNLSTYAHNVDSPGHARVESLSCTSRRKERCQSPFTLK